MSDEELEEYINKIEPNFDSHLEKGTIEMSNEYYNLLEEKMVRLINKNQELKEVIDKAIEYIEYNNETLYTYEPDYDYEENIVDNYDISSYREDLLKILRG